MTTMLKFAEPVNSVGDVEYERAFSNLAHSAIRKKAPALVPYEVGFQLLDRAEDDTKAVGALVYQVGKKTLVVPLVFVNGELKGADAIYLQDDNLYLPLSEEWTKAILSHYTQPIGDGVNRGRAAQGYTAPDMQVAYGLRPKYAAAMESCFRKIRDTSLQEKVAGLKNVGLVDFLKKSATSGQFVAFVDALKSDPLLADWYQGRFGFDTLKVAAKQIQLRESGRSLLDTPKVAAAPKVELIRYNGVMATKLASEDQSLLARQGWLIRDDRDPAAQATLVKAAAVLKNPSRNGVYEVLKLDGTFVKALVITKPIVRGINGSGLFRDGEMAVVVAMDGERQQVNVPLMQVWTRSEEPELTGEWMTALPTLDNLSAPEEDTESLKGRENKGSNGISLVDPSRPVTMEMTGKKREDVDYDEKSLREPSYVLLAPECEDATALWWGFRESPGNSGRVFTGSISDYLDCRDLSVSETTTRMLRQRQTVMLEGIVVEDKDDIRPTHVGNGFIRLPKNWRALKIGKGILRLGNPRTFAFESTKLASRVVLSGSNGEFVVDNQRFSNTADATWRLVDGFGLSVKDASEVLASVTRKTSAIYVKAAAPAFPDMSQFAGSEESPYAGGFSGASSMGGQMAVQDPQQEPPPVPDYTFIRDNMQDSSQGQLPELTELGGLTSLLQTSSEDRIIDENLPTLTKACDAIAKLLLHLYIHTDVFVNRYGKSDTKELESGLKNTLEATGKTLYHLKHRTVSSQPESMLIDQDLRDSTD